MSGERELEPYPSFSRVFAPSEGSTVPLYLQLLNFGDERGTNEALAAVRQGVAGSPDLEAEVVALFAGPNWRPHLFGAAALLVGASSPGAVDALWRAFDSGSWVSPQLGATALLVDPAFPSRARARLEAGCRIDTERLAGLDWRERHIAAGPNSFSHHSIKALAVLVHLCRQVPGTEGWLEPLTEDADVHRRLAEDVDGGDRIAAQWLDCARLMVASR